jgi:hypothetical protein
MASVNNFYDYGNTDFRTPAQMLKDHQLKVSQNNTGNLIRQGLVDEGLAQRAVNIANATSGGIGIDFYDYGNSPTDYTYAAPAPKSSTLSGKVLPAQGVKPSVRSPVKNATTISPERQAIMDQQRLLNQQLGTSLKVDGIMGPQTQKAMNTMQGRREADLARAVQAEAATMAPQQQQQQMVQPTVTPKQQGWTLDKEATDRMHQQWLNNELPEGSIPTAVYNGPSEGLAAKLAGWFK